MRKSATDRSHYPLFRGSRFNRSGPEQDFDEESDERNTHNVDRESLHTLIYSGKRKNEHCQEEDFAVVSYAKNFRKY
ncbi:unannotated protein [freshwater metagenome]|uniref:Unannotated protein n=1 Tax=freshwater metagenome TaxID=449393 RepID=A0A6J6N667_9ZZZZ